MYLNWRSVLMYTDKKGRKLCKLWQNLRNLYYILRFHLMFPRPFTRVDVFSYTITECECVQ